MDSRPPQPPPDQLLHRWPHHDDPAIKKHPLPMPSDDELIQMEAEAETLSHSARLESAPVSRAWVQRVKKWFEDLGREANADHHVIYLRFRQCLHRWRDFVTHLPPPLAKQLLHIIEHGYAIPWAPGINPNDLRHDCKQNPPMMQTRVQETWAIFKKTLDLGAIQTFDVSSAKPPIVCPVFFVDEGDKLRVVHNLKWPNARMDERAFPVYLETIQRIRGIFPVLGWLTVTDFSKAYLHVPLKKGHDKFLTFALTEKELPAHAVKWLRRNHKHCERDGRFFFSYRTVNFGFAPSARVFCLFSQACQHVWARCPSLTGEPNSLSSYIDDWAIAATDFKAAIYLTLNVLAGMRLLGWLVNMSKTKPLPRREQIHLSIIVNLREYTFRLSPKRRSKLIRKILLLRQEVTTSSGKVKCRSAASLVGSIWSTAPVLNNIVHLWCRNIIRELAKHMRIRIQDFTLTKLLRQFWKGSIPWTPAMDRELRFWEAFDFELSYALISRKAILKRIKAQLQKPDGTLAKDVQVIAQDASAIASGMQRMRLNNCNRWVTVEASMVYFSLVEKEYSSTLREIMGSLWALQALTPSHLALPRTAEPLKVILPCDNMNTIRAIERGSRNAAIHEVAIKIYELCVRRNIQLITVWTERTHYIIEEADLRGRFVEQHDYRTPPLVVRQANKVARRLWGRPLEFDRAASAKNALPGMKFNSLWPQPGSSGVDLFEQQDWHRYINFVHLPFAQIQRLLAFLPTTRSKVAVLVPMIHARVWTPKTLPGAPGFVHRMIYSPSASPLLAHRSQHPSRVFRGRYAVIFYDFSK